jgi:hypothetical protein
MRADFDCRSALRKRYEIMLTHDPEMAPVLPSLLGPDSRARIYVNGVEATRKPISLEVPFPKFDQLPGERWIIAAAWSGPNARILDRGSDVARRVDLGGGIAHVQSDAAGNIWVGYFDEGVFDPEYPLGAAGLNRFDDTGAVIWRHDDPNYCIADCYAMSVAEDAAWCCSYPDFPILRIDFHGAERSWTCPVAGAGAIAVHGDLVLLAGGYGERGRIGSLVRLEAGNARLVKEFELGVDLHEATMKTGRGHRLHVVVDDEWFVFEVAHVAEQLGIELA